MFVNTNNEFILDIDVYIYPATYHLTFKYVSVVT